MSINLGEILIVALVVLIVFGGNRLPALGDGIGRMLANLKRGQKTDDGISIRDKTDPKNDKTES